MTGTIPLPLASVRPLRIMTGIGGLICLIAGLVITFWPGPTAAVITVILAVYALLGGVVILCIGVFGPLRRWPRIGHILAGIVFIGAAVVAMLNPARSAALLGAVVVGCIAAAWIVQGIATLAMTAVAPSKGWNVFSGIIGIVGGIALLIAPLVAATVLFVWLGVSLIVIGIVEIVRAFTLGRR